jgi:hypothetical protein
MAQDDTANTITLNLSLVCSSSNYDPSFRAIVDSAEALRLNFSSCVAEAYNTPFSMDELWKLWNGPETHLASTVSINLCCLIFHQQAGSFW